jgi:hypothetical protein
MVAVDQLQLHFSALLIAARKNNQATAFALVPDNPVAPKQILSTPRHQPASRVARTRSSMERLSSRISPKPTKKLPKRSSSAPCSILKHGGKSNESSRWTSESTHCGCEAKRSRSAKKSTCSSSNKASRSPPRIPRRTTDQDHSCAPPQLPKRKEGDARAEWKNLPPQLPCRLPDTQFELECF